MHPTVHVRALCPDDWKTARDVRLAALADAPEAFAAMLPAQRAKTEADWRAMLSPDSGVRAVAEDAGEIAGVIGVVGRDELGEIIWMWAAPEYRGIGVADALVSFALDWCASRGLRCVLWVAEENERARRFYLRLGFVATGVRQPFPTDPDRTEFEMAYAPA